MAFFVSLRARQTFLWCLGIIYIFVRRPLRCKMRFVVCVWDSIGNQTREYCPWYTSGYLNVISCWYWAGRERCFRSPNTITARPMYIHTALPSRIFKVWIFLILLLEPGNKCPGWPAIISNPDDHVRKPPVAREQSTSTFIGDGGQPYADCGLGLADTDVFISNKRARERGREGGRERERERGREGEEESDRGRGRGEERKRGNERERERERERSLTHLL